MPARLPNPLDTDPDAEFPERFINSNLRRMILARDGTHCQYCGRDAWQTATGYAIDHVIPFRLGGPTAAYNLVLACEFCNLRKRTAVWAPRNLDQITVRRPDWRARVLAEALIPDFDHMDVSARTERVTVSLTPDECLQVREHAAVLQLTPSQYVRMALRGQLMRDLD